MKYQDREFQEENQQYHLPFLLSPLKNKEVQASYTGKNISTEGGALLLREMDSRLGLTDKLSGCIKDERDQRYIEHQFMDWSAGRPDIHFVTGLSGNRKLNELTAITIASAERNYHINGMKQKHLYKEKLLIFCATPDSQRLILLNTFHDLNLDKVFPELG